MITKKIALAGAAGRMGTACREALAGADDLELVACIDRVTGASPADPVATQAPWYDSATEALAKTHPDVMVDFTAPASVEANIRTALAAGVDCVVGTTGLSAATLEALAKEIPEGTCLFVAPNFAIGAVLLMQLAARAARWMPDVEIIELHHNQKKDAPSGTAIRTAELIAEAREKAGATALGAPGSESELAGYPGARGARSADIVVHSVRLPGLVAHEEVIFGAPGQTLTLRHDSLDRVSFMPGVLAACRAVTERSGLIVGLENLIEL
ncbi:MAG: 4-hydroxy-tetrahydrodipicolinate reductase [Coriobacteriia bacterium]|nr:4-hydroxy-tetrahydrodipicolinate reductase [Coriobacteriia bacterium]